MLPSARRWVALPLLFVAGACATSETVAKPGSGPVIVVGDEAQCRSVPGSGGTTTGLVPDAQLCTDLIVALKEELHGAGYKIAPSTDAPHAAAASIIAHQSLAPVAGQREAAFLTVQVTVASDGREVERAAQDGNTTDAGGNKQQVRAFARAIATDLARSSRMRAAGLVPGR